MRFIEGVQPPLATITIQQQKCHKITKYHLAADFVGGSKMYQLARLGWRGAALLVTAADIEFLSESAK